MRDCFKFMKLDLTVYIRRIMTVYAVRNLKTNLDFSLKFECSLRCVNLKYTIKFFRCKNIFDNLIWILLSIIDNFFHYSSRF